MNRKKRYLFIFFFIIIFFFLISIVSWYVLSNIVIVKQQPFHYVVQPGTSAKRLANIFQEKADLQYPRIFCLMSRLRGVDHALQRGEYFFPVGSTIASVLDKISQGKVYYHTFTIVDGWTIRQLLKALNKAPELKHTLVHLSQKAIAKKLNLKQNHLEGLFFPNTYFYVRHSSDLQLLQRADKMMQTHLQSLWKKRNRALPYKNAYQVLIVASLVEKETSIAKERPLIAAVILKRWQKWIPLQIDATVIYGLGSHFSGNLTRADLHKPTPYNTYVHYGLPPTPIAMPGLAAIYAALHPAKTEALYFVAKGDGTHVFSKTLKGHDKAVEKYQRGE